MSLTNEFPQKPTASTEDSLFFGDPQVAAAPAATEKPKRRIVIRKTVMAKPKPVEKRQISSIGFPYVDLETVIAVARAMHEVGGYPLTRDQLAGALKQSPTSGSFILKTSAARQFGLVEQSQGNKYQLTVLGFAIVGKDEAQEKAARVAAFLNVALYKRAYDEFRGRPMPPRPSGLENAFVQFGVAFKQKDTARQIFEKSARQAGFLSVDPDRLIEPPTGPLSNVERVPSPEVPVAMSASAPFEPESRLDPLIQGLVDRLPEAGSVWSPEKRARWLQTLAANFDMIYESESDHTVSVELKRGSALD